MVLDENNIMHGPEELHPIPNMSLAEFLLFKLKSHGDKVAQIHAVTGETLTFREILTKSLSVAENLRMHGVRSGDAVGICSENTLEFYLAVLGALFVGATCAPLNPVYTTRELLHALNISKPSVVFSSQQTASRMEEAARKVTFLKKIVVFGAAGSHTHIPLADLLRNKHPNEVVYKGQDCNVMILCSSGTTGMPKGVMLTDKNLLTCYGHMTDPRFAALSKDDVMLGILPFFHAYGCVCELICLGIGMQTIVIPKFEEELFLRSIQNYKVTLMFLVPPLLVFLGKHPLVPRYDLSSVKDIWSGAAPLSEEVQAHVIRRIKLRHIRQGYGMTETTLAVLLTPPDWNKHGSSGMLAPGTECKVVDLKTGKALGPYKSGELCFRGPLMMRGYCGNLQATSAMKDEEGYLHTGDIGYFDNDGFFFVVDRLKELIKYKGFQVPPAELEAILLTHPAIKDSAVIGIPDDDAGELPLAFVVFQPGRSISKEEVMKFVADQVSPQKRLHGGVIFLDTIPKTVSGKILRRELRETVKSKL